MFSRLVLKGKLTTAILTLSVCALLLPGVVSAQESNDWEFRLTPYLWALGLDGTTAALGNDVPVEADFGDLLDLLNFAFSLNMELNNGKWYVVLDPMIADLEAPIDTGGPIGGKVNIDLIIVDAHVGISLSEHFDIYAGARYYDQDIVVVPNSLPEIPLGDDWTDFLIGVRAHSEISEKWSFTGKLDGAVGGDSDSAWYAQALFVRQIGDNKNFAVGYRYYDVDYASGSGLTLFKWDAAHSGPLFAFSWLFGR